MTTSDDAPADAGIEHAADCCDGEHCDCGADCDCDTTLRELHTYLDDELSASMKVSISHHLDGCPDCLCAYDFYAELKVTIATKCANDELPPGLLTRLERCFEVDLDGDGRIG